MSLSKAIAGTTFKLILETPPLEYNLILKEYATETISMNENLVKRGVIS